MSARRNLYLLLAGLALVGASLACGLGAAPEAGAPPPAEEPAATQPPQPTQEFLLPEATQTLESIVPLTETTPQPAIPESRRLTLEFPPVIRTGDSARVRLQLEVDDKGNVTPTAIVEGNVVTGEVVQIPNLYETHFVVAEARLDMAGVEVQPQGTISEPMSPGKPVTFYWSVHPEESGRYEGTVWLHLHFIPMTTLIGEQESRIVVSVQFLDIEAKSFLGFMKGGAARGIGALGSVVGSVLGFPFVDDFLKWLWGRIKRK
ncbi:MAG: hypothetical protein AB8I58_03740 [Anaerolineales bacterium]